MIAANIVLPAPGIPEQGALQLLEPGREYGRLEKPLTGSLFSPGNEIGLLEWEIGRGYPVSDQTMPLILSESDLDHAESLGLLLLCLWCRS